jgi:serine/threonine protein kinase
VSNEGWPLLTGFGISRLNYDGITLSGASILKGNVRWMAIELIEPGVHEQRHNFHTRQSDIWAFGMVVYVSVPP